MKVAILSDGIPGHENQSIGILNLLEEEIPIKYDVIVLNQKFYPFRALIKIYKKLLSQNLSIRNAKKIKNLYQDLELENVDLLIATGGNTAHISASLGKIYNLMTIQNGKLPQELLAQSDPRWSTGATFLVDLLPSFNALAEAYYNKWGKKLGLNGAYRTYASAKKICGPIQANGKCENKLSSLPGTSRHGWGAAFDWQLTISWINDYGHKDEKARREARGGRHVCRRRRCVSGVDARSARA